MLAKDWLKEILKNLKRKKNLKKELLKSKELVLTYFCTEGI